MGFFDDASAYFKGQSGGASGSVFNTGGARTRDDFSESDHPRGSDGKFGSGGSSKHSEDYSQLRHGQSVKVSGNTPGQAKVINHSGSQVTVQLPDGSTQNLHRSKIYNSSGAVLE